jgi:hypothetical protein
VVFMSLMAKIWPFHSFTIKIWASWWQRYELFIALPSRFKHWIMFKGDDFHMKWRGKHRRTLYSWPLWAVHEQIGWVSIKLFIAFTPFFPVLTALGTENLNLCKVLPREKVFF